MKPTSNHVSLPRVWPIGLALVLASTSANAQFGNEWVTFHQDNSRLVADPVVGLNDVEEKDYAWGDLDQDGWIDLVCVRKEPFTTLGREANVLFMNEGGTLVDRTADYARSSSVSGDEGFLTETNDRDVILFDANGDGWLDIITATTLMPGTSKAISHPRIYINLKDDGGGNWLGFHYDEPRIPELKLSNGTPSWPKFCSVDAGDVTGDGHADLYFGDYDSGLDTGGDMNDRLLINDGTGTFVDESTLRMTAQMLESAFGNSVAIRDFNMDGENDILKDTALVAPQYVSLSYNDPSNVGFFSLFDEFHHDAPYHTSAGDLNNDGRPDVVVSDDGDDRYRYNQGTDIFGRVTWSHAYTFDFLSGSDDGFGSNNLMVDLDDDGFEDIIIADVDVDISGCSRRCHIYHNPGGAVGGEYTLLEEAQQSGGGGWKGVVGLTAGDLQGTHDVAVFDLDNDGDNDMVFGRCNGTDVWINDLYTPSSDVGTVYCDCSGDNSPCSNPGAPEAGCANSVGNGGSLVGAGSASVAADDLLLNATGLIPGQAGLLFQGTNAVNGGAGITFGDGLRCAGGAIIRLGTKVPDAGGAVTWGPGLQAIGGWSSGDLLRFQGWYRDPVGSICGSGFNLTNGVEVTFVP